MQDDGEPSQSQQARCNPAPTALDPGNRALCEAVCVTPGIPETVVAGMYRSAFVEVHNPQTMARAFRPSHVGQGDCATNPFTRDEQFAIADAQVDGAFGGNHAIEIDRFQLCL